MELPKVSRWVVLGVLGGVTILGGAFWLNVAPATAMRVDIPEVVVAYQPQKVVYHVASKGTWRDRESEASRLIAVVKNHVSALEPYDPNVIVVLQGDGVDALQRARSNPKLGAGFDALRAKGVKFLICRNSLVSNNIPLEALHGARREDLLNAGVAEIAQLQMQGYSYIKF